MDTIEIRVESHQGQAVPKPWAALFGLAGGTIGSGGQNRLVLPDAHAQVDRVHALVRLQADKAYVVNLCERHSLLVDEVALPPGQEALLPVGARLHLGPYTLRAALPGGARASAAPADPHVEERTAPTAGSPALALDDDPLAFTDRVGTPAQATAPMIPDDFDPFARDLERERREQDPWAEGLAAQNLAEMAVEHDGLLRTLPPLDRFGQPSMLAPNAVRGLPAALDAPRELDPLRLFDEATTQPGLAPPSARLVHGSELHQAIRLPQVERPGPAPQPAQEAPSARQARAAQERPLLQPAAPLPAAQAAGLERLDGLDLTMFDRPPSAPAAEAPAAPEAAVFAAFDADLAPTQIQPLRAPAPIASRPALDLNLDLACAADSAPAAGAGAVGEHAAGPAPAPSASTQALLQAFVEGLGLPASRVGLEPTPEFMRRSGELLRTAVQGTMDLLQTRSELKREFRADVTIMAQRANNPLKFLPDAEAVLMQLLGQTMPGFTPPIPAMREAFRDLRVHQLALLAGMRAAYLDALARLDPAELEKQVAASAGLLGRLGRSSRKAALWDQYRERYADIRRQGEGEASAFAGRSFVKAYDAAVDAALDDDELPGAAR